MDEGSLTLCSYWYYLTLKLKLLINKIISISELTHRQLSLNIYVLTYTLMPTTFERKFSQECRYSSIILLGILSLVNDKNLLIKTV